jgi:uncharacterized alkaline shock family protein YloU
MLSKSDIEQFCNIANNEYAFRVELNTILLTKGRKIERQNNELIVIDVMLKIIYGYDPTDITNCLTYEQVYDIIQYIAVKFDICIPCIEEIVIPIKKKRAFSNAFNRAFS